MATDSKGSRMTLEQLVQQVRDQIVAAAEEFSRKGYPTKVKVDEIDERVVIELAVRGFKTTTRQRKYGGLQREKQKLVSAIAQENPELLEEIKRKIDSGEIQVRGRSMLPATPQMAGATAGKGGGTNTETTSRGGPKRESRAA